MRTPASAAEARGLSRTSRCCSTLPDRSRRARSCSRFLVLNVVRARSLPSALQRATTSRSRPISADCAAASLSCPTLPNSPTVQFFQYVLPMYHPTTKWPQCLGSSGYARWQGLGSKLASKTPPTTACMHGVNSKTAGEMFVHDVTRYHCERQG